LKIFDALCPRIHAGESLAAVGREFQKMAEDAGYKPGGWLLHGRGLGDDLPLMPTAKVEGEDVFEEGNVLILKPGLVPSHGGGEGMARAGETVVVTKEGAKRLGRRRLEVMEIPIA
jgi:Xaa-Pro aminopeptidase